MGIKLLWRGADGKQFNGDRTMNDLATIREQAITAWAKENQWAAIRGIDEPTWNALCSTIYPGAKPDSILMAVDYCRARGLDPMLKPVHLVPMSVKNAQTNNYEWRDVPMPGVGLYRIQAERSGTYAGADEPEFGPTITAEFPNKDNGITEVSYPEWCSYTVHKVVGDRLVKYVAKEFWLENYAVEKNTSEAPNAMWKKRPFAQLAKCAEAQALRKGWPEIGQELTAEEMEGKEYHPKDITPQVQTLTEEPLSITGDQEEQIKTALQGASLTLEQFCKSARITCLRDLQPNRFDAALQHIQSFVGDAATQEENNEDS